MAMGSMLPGVEVSSVANSLPELYRAVLERIASLERTGHRHEAFLIRRASITAYSRAWDAKAHQQLIALQVRAERVLDGMAAPRASIAPRAELRALPRPLANHLTPGR